MKSACASAILLALAFAPALAGTDRAASWRAEWPATDFSRATVPLEEIETVVGRDDIRSIDRPRFVPVREVLIEDGAALRFQESGRGGYARRVSVETPSLSPRDPVIALSIDGDARAYPLRIMTWHEIVNDTVGGKPVAVTFCPLCNAAVVF